MQIATFRALPLMYTYGLCLHTPRADWNSERRKTMSMTSLCLHTPRADWNFDAFQRRVSVSLCLHTPRADWNSPVGYQELFIATLPPHAPCRLEPPRHGLRSRGRYLCLHTPRADWNGTLRSTDRRYCTLPPHAPCRLERQKCTELQYALFRTCVELVDSFSVLNKAMLR